MAKLKKLTQEDDELLAELGIDVVSKNTSGHTAWEERVISGFNEIQEFFGLNGRLPEQGESKDIFERLYAVRLEQIRKQPACRTLLKDLDYQRLLGESSFLPDVAADDLDDEELLAQLGIADVKDDSITNLKHVRPQEERSAAEEIATRVSCLDFETFRSSFQLVKQEIKTGYRKTVPFRKDAGFTKTSLKVGQFLIISGQITLLVEIGDSFKAPNGEDDARLRVIYDNGTESNVLLRSLIRAMYRDEASRFITESNEGPLFSGENTDGDQASGTIYVLRSLSTHPHVQANKAVVHKIGVTGGEIKKRLVNAKNDPTFLMADVEIIATYNLANINRFKLEKLLHKFFSAAKFDIEITDRFGRPVKATEWFLVPLFIIDQTVERIKDGTLGDYYYNHSSATLVKQK